MDQYQLIRTAHLVYGKGIREIAREYGHSRKTVKKALKGLAPEYRREKAPARPVMDPFQEVIEGWLLEDQSQPRKQRHTAHRIYMRLVLEYGFAGAESTVRRYVRERKAKLGLSQQEAYVPLQAEIESGAEVDWGEAKVVLQGETCKIKLFCMRSKYSGKIFVRAYLAERQEMLLDAHLHAFEYFGGVFRELVYDNLGTVVKRIMEGRGREEREQFGKFRAYYAFQSRFCTPGKGNEKGGVEGTVGYVRRNFLTPMPRVESLDLLNGQLLTQCLNHGRRLKNSECRQTIDDLHEEQRLQLLPVQQPAFANHRLLTCRADKYQTIRVDHIWYSVPACHVGHELNVHLGCDRVRIYHGGQLVAQHRRCLQRGTWCLNPFDYLPTIGRKPGSFEEARPLKAWRKTWPPYYETLLGRLRRTRGESRGTKAFVEVLRLHEIYPREVVEEAVRSCVEKGASCPNAVKHLIFKRLEKPLPTPEKREAAGLPDPIYGPPNLNSYDALLSQRGGT